MSIATGKLVISYLTHKGVLQLALPTHVPLSYKKNFVRTEADELYNSKLEIFDMKK